MQIAKPRLQDRMRRKISISLFEAGLKCMTKCFLRSQGETGSGNPYADWVRTQAESYQEKGIKCFIEGHIYDDYTVNWSGIDNLKGLKRQLASDLT